MLVMMERRGQIKMTTMLVIGGIPRIMIRISIRRRERSTGYDRGVGRTKRGKGVGMVGGGGSGGIGVGN